MSLRQKVFALIAEHGPADGDEIHAHLPSYERHRVLQAVQNLRYERKLKTVERSRGKGPVGGKTLAKYVVQEGAECKPPAPRVASLGVNSIFQLGERCSMEAA